LDADDRLTAIPNPLELVAAAIEAYGPQVPEQ
jgi:hypothetical protein